MNFAMKGTDKNFSYFSLSGGGLLTVMVIITKYCTHI